MSTKNQTKRSIVWTYFENVDSFAKKAKCEICDAYVMFSGNSSNLKFHLQRHHAERWPALVDSESEFNKKDQELMDSFVVKEDMFYPTNSEKHKKITCELIKMVAKDLQPFSIVEDTGFKNMITALDPKYKIPTRKSLASVHLDTLYNNEVLKLRKEISLVNNIHLTTDIWTDSKNQLSYMTVTCHYIKNLTNWQLTSAVLKTVHFPSKHSSENIFNEILVVCDEWQINSKIEGVVTDNGANVVAAIKMGADRGWFHLPCFAHTLNLVVINSLKNETINSFLTKCRHIVHIFKGSPKATAILYKAQTEMELVPHSLKKDVITRWNSIVTMLRSILFLKPVLPLVLSSIEREDVPSLSYSDWQFMDKIIEILTPFEKVTEEMSAEKFVTCSKIIPINKCLILQLSKIQSTGDARQFQDELIKQLNFRFGKIESNSFLAISTLMDPRFKHLMLSDESVSRYKRKIRDIVLENININAETPNPNVEVGTDNLGDDHGSNENLWSYFDKKAAANQHHKPSTDILVDIEIKQYFDCNIIQRNEDPLKWWELNNHKFPHLAKIAEKYLSIPATSVPSERVFSKAGLLIGDRRCRLSTKNVDKIIFLNMNLQD